MIQVAPEMVQRWEQATDLPDTAAQATLRDLMTGHFKSHPTFLGIKALVQATGQMSALYTPGMIVHTVSSPLERLFASCRFDVIGSSMLSKFDGRAGDMVEKYAIPMLEGRTDILSMSYTDRGIADPRMIVRQQVSVIPLDGVQVLVTVGHPLGTSASAEIPDLDLRITTADDVRG
ncbi:hypothetical protein [Azospirillum sp. SYSU D00513]|uniref:hypothetical protein n=1 Tax=Azospirillum sp. SYSU D00513 TaxID=2812561 RepID=UPI001A95C0CC|nr:hypothetical protein [Azospirillum sp. SYSU D00513]